MKTIKKSYVLILSSLFMIGVMTTVLFVACESKSPIKVMILTGQNNHNWEASSVILQRYLNESGMFVADLIVSPKSGEDMSAFRPDFSAYKAVVLDYNGDSWSDDTRRAFLDYVGNGGGIVVYHAADNAFRDWKEYNEIIGIGGWGNRNETDGPYLYFRDGKEIRDTASGLGGSHGRQHEYRIDVRDTTHPITKGLPTAWTHSKDELYDRLRGPAKDITVLATAYSDTITGGTGRDEPALMTISWGKGRIFHTILGHVGKDATHPAVEGASFIETFLRGTEWAATGKVTRPLPADFPNK
jgi:type 1 glutamine amidotransferase